MKVLIQRVSQAQVCVDDDLVGRIGAGMLLLVGVQRHDTEALVDKMIQKVLAYRLFADADGKMNLNIQQSAGGILVVSQFTLAANTQKGLRPGFSEAAEPQRAKVLFERFVNGLNDLHKPVEQGIFAADMQVTLTNDGPVTFMLEL